MNQLWPQDIDRPPDAKPIHEVMQYHTLNLTTIGKYDPEIKSEIIAFYHLLSSEWSLIGTMSTVVVWQQSKLKR